MTTASKRAPQRGTMPVLQYCTPDQLRVDPLYQRELDARSRQLINRIANQWDWNLFQPLVVARRDDGRLFVVDGQHRLAAARLRRDVMNLPCVIFHSAAPAEEADVFVKLNQERRPLTAYALYNAALATGDEAAIALDTILRQTGWSFVGGADTKALQPGQLNMVGRIRRWHGRNGDKALRTALDVLGRAFRGQALQHPGYLFAAIGALITEHGEALSSHLLVDILARPQEEWHAEFHQRAAVDGTGIEAAAVAAIVAAYAEAISDDDEEGEDDPSPTTPREPASPRAREPASPRAREEGRSVGGPLVNGKNGVRLVGRELNGGHDGVR